MAGATALTFLEKNILKLVSTYCSQLRAHHSIKLPPSLQPNKRGVDSENESLAEVAEVLQTAPVFLRPVQAVVPGIFRAVNALIGDGLTYKGYKGLGRDGAHIDACLAVDGISVDPGILHVVCCTTHPDNHRHTNLTIS